MLLSTAERNIYSFQTLRYLSTFLFDVRAKMSVSSTQFQTLIGHLTPTCACWLHLCCKMKDNIPSEWSVCALHRKKTVYGKKSVYFYVGRYMCVRAIIFINQSSTSSMIHMQRDIYYITNKDWSKKDYIDRQPTAQTKERNFSATHTPSPAYMAGWQTAVRGTNTRHKRTTHTQRRAERRSLRKR